MIPKTNDADKNDVAKADQPAGAEVQPNLGEILTTDFMKDIVSDMNLDIDANAMNEIME